MKIFSRIVMVLVLLSGLAYASYVLGNRVVSKKMFGDIEKQRDGSALRDSGSSAVASKTRVRKALSDSDSVQTLPAHSNASQAGDNSSSDNANGDSANSDTTFSDLQRATHSRMNADKTPNSDKIVRADSLPTPDAGLSANNGSAIGEPTPRRKRRRRRRNSNSDTSTTRSVSSGDTARANGADTSSNTDSNTGSSADSSSEVPRAESSSDRQSERNSARHSERSSRESSSRSNSGSSDDNDSPVPRAENSGGSSSAATRPFPKPNNNHNKQK